MVEMHRCDGRAGVVLLGFGINVVVVGRVAAEKRRDVRPRRPAVKERGMVSYDAAITVQSAISPFRLPPLSNRDS